MTTPTEPKEEREEELYRISIPDIQQPNGIRVLKGQLKASIRSRESAAVEAFRERMGQWANAQKFLTPNRNLETSAEVGVLVQRRRDGRLHVLRETALFQGQFVRAGGKLRNSKPALGVAAALADFQHLPSESPR